MGRTGHLWCIFVIEVSVSRLAWACRLCTTNNSAICLGILGESLLAHTIQRCKLFFERNVCGARETKPKKLPGQKEHIASHQSCDRVDILIALLGIYVLECCRQKENKTMLQTMNSLWFSVFEILQCFADL